MSIDFSQFIEVKYSHNELGEHSLFFDFQIDEEFGHKRTSKSFEFHETLLKFLMQNPTKKLYITNRKLERGFLQEDDNFTLNIGEFQRFCKKLNARKDRASAFFRQEVSIDNLIFNNEIRRKVMTSVTEDEILQGIKGFTQEQKKSFLVNLEKIDGISGISNSELEISDKKILEAFSRFIEDPEKKGVVFSQYSKIQISILEDHIKFLEDNLDKGETFIQNWIDGKIDNEGNAISLDEDGLKTIKRSRCLIFGLEYISHKREGNTSSKRFDILTRMSEGNNEYVLIELKSPTADVFRIDKVNNLNEGVSTTYSLSPDLSRAIPQILDYKNLLENGTDTEWQKIGAPKGKIAKLIVILGSREVDPVWDGHFLRLKHSLSSSIEIMTYSDLITKLDTTIKNLKNNL